MTYHENPLLRKLKDIENIEFGNTVEDISSSLLIITTLYEHDDNPQVIKASKVKLQEGISLLIEMGEEDQAREYSV